MVPTDEQIRQYRDALPQIYRDVLKCFPEASPQRREGDGLAVESVVDHLVETNDTYREEDVRQAVQQLTTKGLLEERAGSPIPFVHPTTVCERLITSLTGRRALPHKIPDLPVPAWMTAS